MSDVAADEGSESSHDAVPVIQRLARSGGDAVVRAATVEIHISRDDVDTWVYLGDGEHQMLEVSAESARRLVAVLAQSLDGGSEASSESGSTER